MSSSRLRIADLADHLDLGGTIARWHWNEWGSAEAGESLAAWTAGLCRRTNRDAIPTTFVALDGEELLGSVSLVEHDLPTRVELSPWVAGVYVKPAARGRGVASALVRHAVRAAADMGVARLYLYTEHARGLYEKLGWRVVAEEEYRGEAITIMALDVTGDGR